MAQAHGSSCSRSRTTRRPPASTCRFMERLVAFAREHEVVLVHDFAYADLGFDGYDPPSILQVPGANGRRGRDLHDDQVVLHGRVARRLRRGQPRDRPGADQAQDVPRLRDVPADPDRRHRGDERGAGVPQGDQPDLPVTPRHAVRRAQPHRVAPGGRPRGRCSSGPRSPSPTARWDRWSSRSTWSTRPTSPPRPGSGSGPAATATSASPSSRTSSASARPCATCAAR